ncbi:MAG: proline--tRNA ligase [Myxococcales bacterium]|nr:proline--tRNA ligase [Myxococcota bacterium]MDW8282387.1 proline--tRNA ligase [Myxococcales bacterium]
MRFSQMLIPTLKEAPSDARVPSHVLLVRAGYIRQVAAGIFSLLPLGMRVVHRIERIVRQELNRAGAMEVLLPMVHPAPLWQESGRWQVYGPQLLRLRDRKEFEFALAPTAEEAIVALVRDDVRSYRRLPLNLYQIQDKFRDEDRPRAGLMRGREFIMKDGYSFHVDEEDARREYQNMYDTYTRIFRRCGLDFRAVEADTGNIGGSLSHEFQVLADTGEDSIVSCDACDYAANVEKAVLRRQVGEPPDTSATPPCSPVHTPGVGRIEEVAAFLQTEPQRLLKTLLYIADGKPVAALLRGDRQLNEAKFRTLLGASQLDPASDAQVRQLSGAEVGFAGPVGLAVPLYADLEVVEMGPAFCGANRTDYHLQDVVFGRDYQAQVADLRVAAAGDPCGRCERGRYRHHRGIEVGHVFFLGTRYSEPMRCEFLDREGRLRPMVMGCYGIGITRVVAAAVEQNHDEHGIRWPMALAPFHVILVTAGLEPGIGEMARRIYDDLQVRGVDVLYDDRDERPGVKFKDADLIGIPVRITVGRKALSDGMVEVRRRDGKLDTRVPLQEVASVVSSMVQRELEMGVAGA